MVEHEFLDAGARHGTSAESSARTRAESLHEVAAALLGSASRSDVASVIVNQAFEALGAHSAVAYFSEPDGHLALGASRGLAEEVLLHIQTLRLDAPLPLANAVLAGEPIWIESHDALLARYPHLRQAKTPPARLQAVAALPLRINDRTVGGVAFSFGAPRAFEEDERKFLLTLVNHAALATERCRLRDEEERARTRLTILAEVSERFSEAKLELRETLDTVAQTVASRLRESCAINLLSNDGQVLELVALANVDRELDESVRRTLAAAPVRMDEGSSLTRVVKTGEAILVPVVAPGPVSADARPEYREHLQRFPIGSLLIVPLRSRGELIGTITVTRAPGSPAYTREDQILLGELADRAGLAIAHARQYEELALERRGLDVLAKASAVLATSLDYETTLRNVIELALPSLGDFGFFDVAEPNGEVRRLARAHRDAQRQALLDQTRWARSERKDKNLCALSSGASGLHPRIDAAWLEDVATSPEHLRLMQKLNFGSMLTVPLAYRGATLGALTLFFARDNRRHTRADLSLAEELARRAAAAVENARLFKESREAISIRDDFLSIAGHELNTPLTALQLQIRSLKHYALREAASSNIIERLAKTEAHAVRLEKLIRELLDVSRISGGRLDIEREPMDLAAMLKEVTERVAPQAANAGCRLVLMTEGSVLGTWDRLRIDQVVTNLLGNSIKYGPGQPIEVALTHSQSTARISVRDFGIGISAADQERIFGRFERAVSQRHYGGLGLGLWIARQIVEAHGGSIRFESPGDVGTRFIVELPMNAGA